MSDAGSHHDKRRLLISNWGSLAREMQRDVDQWEAMIRDWKVRPVRSFEEIQEQVKAQREAAAGTRQRALADKQKKMIESLQKRIDAALKGMAADYQKTAKKGSLDALWLSTDWAAPNRLKSLYEMVSSGLLKLRDDGRMDIGTAAEALSRPAVIRGLGLADQHDVLRLVRKELSRGGYRESFPGWDGPWVDAAGGSRVQKPSETHLRAREGMMAYFAR